MSTDNEGNETSISTELTWQEAKANTQKTELEIAATIPENVVVSIEQREQGILFSCNQTEHNWNGTTTISVAADTVIEPLVKEVQAHFQDSQFTISSRLDIAGNYEVQLVAPDGGESYLIGEGLDSDSIRIDSGSACFTLPEGIYPGGDF